MANPLQSPFTGSNWSNNPPGSQGVPAPKVKQMAPPPTQAQRTALVRLAAAVARVGGRAPGSKDLFVP